MSDRMESSLTDTRLIAATLVNGTSVYEPDGTRIGAIEDIMIDKQSGTARFAILSFGGFLGIGDKHYPLPWASLKYDPGLGGYVINVSRARMEGGPSYAPTEPPSWHEAGWGQRLDDYYAPPI